MMGLFHDGQDVALAHDGALLAVHLDLGAGIFGGENLIAHFDDHLYFLTVHHAAGTNGHDLGAETPMGQGRVDFPALLKGLHALGYDGCITIEREIEGDQQAVDILAARDMLQGILAAL